MCVCIVMLCSCSEEWKKRYEKLKDETERLRALVGHCSDELLKWRQGNVNEWIVCQDGCLSE